MVSLRSSLPHVQDVSPPPAEAQSFGLCWALAWDGGGELDVPLVTSHTTRTSGVSMRNMRLSGLLLVFFLPEEMKHGGPWETDFYRGKRILLVNFSPQKISKKIIRKPIFSHDSCREVVSGTVQPGAGHTANPGGSPDQILPGVSQ